MKVLFAMVLSLLITVSQALASGGGGDGAELSLLTMLFIGFGALIIVFQLVPAVILLGGMIRGLVSPAEKRTAEAVAKNTDENP